MAGMRFERPGRTPEILAEAPARGAKDIDVMTVAVLAQRTVGENRVAGPMIDRGNCRAQLLRVQAPLNAVLEPETARFSFQLSRRRGQFCATQPCHGAELSGHT